MHSLQQQEKGPVGTGGSLPRQRQGRSVKSPFLSVVLCVTSSQPRISCRVGVRREPQAGVLRSQGL